MALIKSTLSEQIYQILRSDILHHRIAPGTKLTLKNLQQQFEVSSTPIRDALTRLADEGLVHYYSNIGVNVIELSRQDLCELYQFMGDLDRLAILYSAGHPDQSGICTELEEAVFRTDEIEQRGLERPLSQEETENWIRFSDRFHLIFYDYCSNSRLKLAAEKLRSQLTIFSNLYEAEPGPQHAIGQMHRQIFEAYKSGDSGKAGDLMKAHLADSLQYALRHC